MYSSRKGQTIIEVMIALSILTVGLLGLLDLLSKSYFLDRMISDQTKATYLSEEGVDLAKNLIDNDMYLSVASGGGAPGWDACFDPSEGHGDYELDYNSMPTSANNRPCPLKKFTGSGDFLGINSSTGLYSYTPGLPATNFTRDVRVTVTTPYELDVQSIVAWSTGPVTSQSIDIEDTFYDWYPTST